MRPDHRGGVVFRRCFSRDSTPDVEAAICHAVRLLEDPEWRGRFLRFAERALEYVNERIRADEITKRLVGRAKEFRFVVVALTRLVEFVMASLEHLIRTGEFDDLKFGLSPEVVRQRIGDPDNVSVSSKPLIWKYGGVELGFCRDQPASPFALDWISIDLRQECPAFVEVGGISAISGMSESEFRQFLEGLACIEREIREDECVAGQLCLDIGVCASFEDGRLVKLFASRFAASHRDLPAQVAAGSRDDRPL